MAVKGTRKVTDDFQNVVVIAIIPAVEAGKTTFLFVKEADGALMFPGGKVKLYESLVEALQREILEETRMNDLDINSLVMIEQSILYDQKKAEIKKSILLYFFFALPGASISLDENDRLTWMDSQLVTSQQQHVPYDNHLIINEMASINRNHRYEVPPGFLDSPKDKSQVAIRSFCWIAQEFQGKLPW